MPLEISDDVKFWSQFIHPVVMWGLLALSLYALYTGFQIIRTRTTDGDTKKELIKGKFNLKHYQIGSILLALMVVSSLMGMGITYLNNGKLFFGPHLLAGLGMTGLIALSASLSPYMQKGQDWARFTHIAINISMLGLFGWQAATGVQIVQRLIEKRYGLS